MTTIKVFGLVKAIAVFHLTEATLHSNQGEFWPGRVHYGVTV